MPRKEVPRSAGGKEDLPRHRLTFVPKLFPCFRQRKCAKGPRKEAPTGWDSRRQADLDSEGVGWVVLEQEVSAKPENTGKISS